MTGVQTCALPICFPVTIAAGSNPMSLKHGIEKAVDVISDELLKMAKPVETREQISATASISAADTTIGSMIAEAMDKVGKEGVITVEESNTFGLELELTEGMRFDKGYISAYFVTDTERMETVMEDAYILIANSKITSIKDLVPVLEKVMQTGKSLVIIADVVAGDVVDVVADAAVDVVVVDVGVVDVVVDDVVVVLVVVAVLS